MVRQHELRDCPDCCVEPGEFHSDGCDVERCPECGGQRLSCIRHQNTRFPAIPWSGIWPGVRECREFGWYSKLIPGKGWVECDKDDPDASEDLNRLHTDAVWDPHKAKFVLPPEEDENDSQAWE